MPASGKEKENGDLPDLLPEGKSDLSYLKKCSYLVGGFILIVVGVVGWILPFMPGIPVVLIGLGLMAVVIGRIRRWGNFCDAKLPIKWRLHLRRRKGGGARIIRESNR